MRYQQPWKDGVRARRLFWIADIVLGALTITAAPWVPHSIVSCRPYCSQHFLCWLWWEIESNTHIPKSHQMTTISPHWPCSKETESASYSMSCYLWRFVVFYLGTAIWVQLENWRNCFEALYHRSHNGFYLGLLWTGFQCGEEAFIVPLGMIQVYSSSRKTDWYVSEQLPSVRLARGPHHNKWHPGLRSISQASAIEDNFIHSVQTAGTALVSVS